MKPDFALRVSISISISNQGNNGTCARKAHYFFGWVLYHGNDRSASRNGRKAAKCKKRMNRSKLREQRQRGEHAAHDFSVAPRRSGEREGQQFTFYRLGINYRDARTDNGGVDVSVRGAFMGR